MHRPKAIRRERGFTLIEIMLAVVIVAVLAAVALPTFQSSIRKSRRSDAINALNAVQQAQERVRANWTQYCATFGPPVGGACGLNVAANSANNHFSLALSGVGATTYVVTATATGAQAQDTACALMAVSMNAGALAYGSGTSSIDWTDANRCWAR